MPDATFAIIAAVVIFVVACVGFYLVENEDNEEDDR